MTAVINDSKKVFTFGQLVERYIAEELPSRPQTAASYKSVIKHLKAQFGDMPLNDMLKDLMQIQAWMSDLNTMPAKHRPARPASKKTKHNTKAMLHRIIECAMRWGYLPVDRNPISLVEVKIKGIQPAKRLKRPLSAKQIKDLIEYPELSEHVRVMVKLCVFMGLRISETLGLRWEDIDLEAVDGPVLRVMRGAVGQHIDETKTPDSNAVLPLHLYLAETLKTWREHSEPVNGWVFGSIATGRPFHRDSLQADHLAPAGRACGIVDLGWHTFRHTQIVRLRKNGTAAEVQMMLMRHSDMRTTNSYGRDDGSLELKRPAHEAMVDALLQEITLETK